MSGAKEETARALAEGKREIYHLRLGLDYWRFLRFFLRGSGSLVSETWAKASYGKSLTQEKEETGEPKARLQQKIEEVDARPLAEVYERTRKRKVNDQSSPLGERWSVVNLSFSFRTPSTSSYLLPGLMVRYGERRQKTTNHDNENSSLISLLEFSLSIGCLCLSPNPFPYLSFGLHTPFPSLFLSKAPKIQIKQP